MSLGLPTAAAPSKKGTNLGRFAFNAAGAGLGITAAVAYVVPALPGQIANIEFFGGFGVAECVVGACALVGAMLGNEIYNRVAA